MSNTISCQLLPLGDVAVLVQFSQTITLEAHRQVRSLSNYLDQHPLPGMIEYIPAFTSVAVMYDMLRTTYSDVSSRLLEIIGSIEQPVDEQVNTVEIPVCYGGELGPDLEFVARHNGLTEEDVIRLHSAGEYLVYMIGFAPGFPYLGGMNEQISAPRRNTPRLSIPIGSVGIAGAQTGVYPIETPGGWQLIGRTPLRLFQPDQNPPSLLQAGDVVRFRPISRAEYQTWMENNL